MAAEYCVLHGPVPPAQLGFDPDCGPVHLFGAGAHTMNGDPCYNVIVRGAEGITVPGVPGVEVQHRDYQQAPDVVAGPGAGGQDQPPEAEGG